MRRFGMMMRLAVTVCAGAIVCPVLVHAGPADDATAAAAVRAQFTAKQWSVLQSIRFTPLVLPAYLPPGFSVSDVALNGHKRPEFAEAFDITYTRGKDTIIWGISNYSGGGDAPPNQFQYAYHSPVIGDGVVRTNEMHCWYTDNLNGPDNGLFGNAATHAQFFFNLESCRGGAPPGELARMAQSMVLVRRGTVLRFKGDYASEATLTAPSGRDVRIFATLDAACGNSNAQRTGRDRVPSTTSVKAGTRVYLLDGTTSGCQGHSTQLPIPTGRWVWIAVPLDGWLDRWLARSADVRRK